MDVESEKPRLRWPRERQQIHVLDTGFRHPTPVFYRTRARSFTMSRCNIAWIIVLLFPVASICNAGSLTEERRDIAYLSVALSGQSVVDTVSPFPGPTEHLLGVAAFTFNDCGWTLSLTGTTTMSHSFSIGRYFSKTERWPLRSFSRLERCQKYRPILRRDPSIVFAPFVRHLRLRPWTTLKGTS
jgi:hypothetical protein